MKLAEKSSLVIGLDEEEANRLRKAVEASTELRDALVKELEQRVRKVESNLQDIEAIAKMPASSAYMMSQLAAKKELAYIINLIK